MYFLYREGEKYFLSIELVFCLVPGYITDIMEGKEVSVFTYKKVLADFAVCDV